MSFRPTAFRWLAIATLVGPLLAGCDLTERFDNPETRINAAIPPDSGVQAAWQRMQAQLADPSEAKRAFEPRWESRLRSRAVLCRRDYLPSWRDSQADIRARLKASECFAEFDRGLERWVGLQRLQMVLAQPALRPLPPTLPLLISHREFISNLVLAREAPVAILQGSKGFDLVDLGTGKSIFSEAASSGRPMINLSPNGRVFAQSASGSVVIRAAEGGETLVELPQADGVLWLDSRALVMRSNSSSGNRGLRLLDLASGEDTAVPGSSNGYAYLSAPVPGSTNRFNLLLNQGADQIEISDVGGRFEAQLRNERRSKSGMGFAINTGGMNADGSKWIDGSQGLRMLDLGTLEMQERTFEPARSTMAWPTANPDPAHRLAGHALGQWRDLGGGAVPVHPQHRHTGQAGERAQRQHALPVHRLGQTAVRDRRAEHPLHRRTSDRAARNPWTPCCPPSPTRSTSAVWLRPLQRPPRHRAWARRAVFSGPGHNRPPRCTSNCAILKWRGVGVYEGMGAVNGGGKPRMPGLVVVRVRRAAAPLALVLASYEPVRWRILMEPGARLSAVFMSSNYPSTVEGADAVRVYQMGGGVRLRA